MAFTRPREMLTGTFQSLDQTSKPPSASSSPTTSPAASPPLPPSPNRLSDGREALADGLRCGLCATTDPAEYEACGRQICFPQPIPVTAESAGFTAPRNLVSAYELAARYRRAADALDWEDDEKRERYLRRAYELTHGSEAEVPNEEVS